MMKGSNTRKACSSTTLQMKNRQAKTAKKTSNKARLQGALFNGVPCHPTKVKGQIIYENGQQLRRQPLPILLSFPPSVLRVALAL